MGAWGSSGGLAELAVAMDDTSSEVQVGENRSNSDMLSSLDSCEKSLVSIERRGTEVVSMASSSRSSMEHTSGIESSGIKSMLLVSCNVDSEVGRPSL